MVIEEIIEIVTLFLLLLSVVVIGILIRKLKGRK